MDVLVFGSINMDLVARTPRLPQIGETVLGNHFETLPGGKGANQAVAVAQLGISVAMLGCVGQDRFGTQLIQQLKDYGVHCDRISIVSGESSGVAIIEVDDQGDNRILVVPGANKYLDVDTTPLLHPYIDTAKVLLLQLETPIPGVIAAATYASKAGLTVILDPAPAPKDLPAELLEHVHILTPNQLEASQLVGSTIETLDDALHAADHLRRQGPNIVIVKLGKQGSICVTEDDVVYTPSFSVNAVDTVAAGDAFNGGFAAAISEKQSLRESLRWATAVSALAVSHLGAQSSMPTRAELYTFFNARSESL